MHYLGISLTHVAVMVFLTLNTGHTLFFAGVSQYKSIFPAVFIYPGILALTGKLRIGSLVLFIKLKIDRKSRKVLITTCG